MRTTGENVNWIVSNVFQDTSSRLEPFSLLYLFRLLTSLRFFPCGFRTQTVSVWQELLDGTLDLRAALRTEIGSHVVGQGTVPQKNWDGFPKEVPADVYDSDSPRVTAARCGGARIQPQVLLLLGPVLFVLDKLPTPSDHHTLYRYQKE